MEYICVRTYGNGKHINKVYPLLFNYLSQAERICNHLNEEDAYAEDKWIVMPVVRYTGAVWEERKAE